MKRQKKYPNLKGKALPRRKMAARIFRRNLWGRSSVRDSPIDRAAADNEAEDRFAPQRSPPGP